MSNRALPTVTPILAVVSMIAISMTVLNYQALLYSGEQGISGRFITPAWAMESETLEKEVGQSVHFKAEVINTGDVETTYLIVAKWSEDGTEEWETAGLADVRLSPGQSETLVIGGFECTEWMMNKYFDVKFILYECEAETVLDEKVIDKAWHVKEIVVSGTLTGFWIE